LRKTNAIIGPMIKKNCVYCTNLDIKSRKIAENDLAFAFLTNIPIVPGHTLIVPKRCIAKYRDLTPKEKEAIEELRKKITKALEKAFGAKGFNYAWNENEVAGQAIPHFHLHVVPRKEGDAGIIEYEPRKFLYRPGSRETTPEKELEKVSELIRKIV